MISQIEAVMQFDRQDIETKEDYLNSPAGVCFDPDNVTLEGVYADELSTFRARKCWVEALENHFLLEVEHDFLLLVERKGDEFQLRCEFLTACARYAFWRLTNNQAPEAQYIIETAHIPKGESQFERFMQAPDLCHIGDGPLIFRGDKSIPEINDKWFEWVKGLVNRLASMKKI
jgi:hypothetical protein